MDACAFISFQDSKSKTGLGAIAKLIRTETAVSDRLSVTTRRVRRIATFIAKSIALMTLAYEMISNFQKLNCSRTFDEDYRCESDCLLSR